VKRETMDLTVAGDAAPVVVVVVDLTADD